MKRIIYSKKIYSLLCLLLVFFISLESRSEVTQASSTLMSELALQLNLQENDQVGVIATGSDISSDIIDIIRGNTFLSPPQNKDDAVYLILQNNSTPYFYNNVNVYFLRGHIIIYGFPESGEEPSIARNGHPVISMNPSVDNDALSIVGEDSKLTLKNVTIDAQNWMSGRAIISVKSGAEVVHSGADIYRHKTALDAKDQNSYYHIIYFLGNSENRSSGESILNISGDSLLFNGSSIGGLIFSTSDSIVTVMDSTLVVVGGGTVIGATGSRVSDNQQITLQSNTIYGCAANEGSSISDTILLRGLPEDLCENFNGKIEATFIRKLPRYRFPPTMNYIAGSNYIVRDNDISGRFATIFIYTDNDVFAGSNNQISATGRTCRKIYDLAENEYAGGNCNEITSLLSNADVINNHRLKLMKKTHQD